MPEDLDRNEALHTSLPSEKGDRKLMKLMCVIHCFLSRPVSRNRDNFHATRKLQSKIILHPYGEDTRTYVQIIIFS